MNKKVIIVATVVGTIVLAAVVILVSLFFREKIVPEKFSIDECRLLSARDIKSVIGGDEVTEIPPLRTDGQCREMLVSMEGTEEKSAPKNTITLSIIDTKVVPSYNQIEVKDYLSSICSGSSLEIGEYNSCSFAGFVFFGKGKYMLQLNCPGCSEEKKIELSKLINGRL